MQNMFCPFWFRIASTATAVLPVWRSPIDRKSTRLNSSHLVISYAVFCLKKKIFTDMSPPRSKPTSTDTGGDLTLPTEYENTSPRPHKPRPQLLQNDVECATLLAPMPRSP